MVWPPTSLCRYRPPFLPNYRSQEGYLGSIALWLVVACLSGFFVFLPHPVCLDKSFFLLRPPFDLDLVLVRCVLLARGRTGLASPFCLP